jgi:hypothetical protein
MSEVEYEEPEFTGPTIDTNQITKNIFFNWGDTGRFGNYIYSAIDCVILLFAFEYVFGNRNPETVIANIKNRNSPSKLYSMWNCNVRRSVGNNETNPNDKYYYEDKYYYNTKKTIAFKYFNCNPSLYNEDVKSRRNLYSTIWLIPSEADIVIYYQSVQIHVVNKIIYYYFPCKKDYPENFVEIKNNFDENINNYFKKIVQEEIEDKIKKLKKYKTYFKNDTIKKQVDNGEYELPELIKKYIKKIPMNDSEHFQLLEAEIKKCFDNTSNNKFIMFSIREHGYKYYLYTNQNFYLQEKPNFEREKNLVKLTGYVKNILFDVPEYVIDFYKKIIEKYEGKEIIILNFRGGDFESPSWFVGFRVLKPKDYLNRIQKILNKTECKPSNAVAICLFHRNDEIFYSYMGIIKNHFQNIEVVTEYDIINQFILDELTKNKYLSISRDETKHVYFMSLFKNFVGSNSTYSKIVAEMNTNLDKNIEYNFDCYGGTNVDSEYCTMSAKRKDGFYINWELSHYIFFYIYTNHIIKNNIEIQNILWKDIYEYLKLNGRKIMEIENGKNFFNNIINYDSNIMKIRNNDEIYIIKIVHFMILYKFSNAIKFVDFDNIMYCQDQQIEEQESRVPNFSLAPHIPYIPRDKHTPRPLFKEEEEEEIIQANADISGMDPSSVGGNREPFITIEITKEIMTGGNYIHKYMKYKNKISKIK